MLFTRKILVASTGIEPVSGASETLILSIVLRGRGCSMFDVRRLKFEVGKHGISNIKPGTSNYFINPAALVANIFTAMASNITPKNFLTAINPAGPSKRAMAPSDFNTI
jgi:hypothetical protein